MLRLVLLTQDNFEHVEFCKYYIPYYKDVKAGVYT